MLEAASSTNRVNVYVLDRTVDEAGHNQSSVSGDKFVGVAWRMRNIADSTQCQCHVTIEHGLFK